MSCGNGTSLRNRIHCCHRHVPTAICKTPRSQIPNALSRRLFPLCLRLPHHRPSKSDCPTRPSPKSPSAPYPKCLPTASPPAPSPARPSTPDSSARPIEPRIWNDAPEFLPRSFRGGSRGLGVRHPVLALPLLRAVRSWKRWRDAPRAGRKTGRRRRCRSGAPNRAPICPIWPSRIPSPRGPGSGGPCGLSILSSSPISPGD
mmetsp:Transcript_18250/g.37482  ORF Transcript_18250/g.37482 Transcript_18250/m.37482 type:complete len:202 (-) Transcript_18250:1241-1846(-)